MSAIEYFDATHSDDTRVDYPEIVDELVGLGFERFGRVVAAPASGSYEEVAAGYEPSDARRFLDHCDVATTVLRSPDAFTTAEVSWFWDSPSVRMRTRLADGTMVETLRQWKHQPAELMALAGQNKHLDVVTDMTKRSVPAKGRSTIVVDTAESAEQWRRHQDHIRIYAQQRASNEVRVNSMEDVIRTMAMAFDHDYAVEEKTVGLWKPTILAYGVAGIAVVLAVFAIGFSLESAPLMVASIVLALVLAVATMPFVRLVIHRFTTIPEWLRPPFV